MRELKNLVIRTWTDEAWEYVRERSITIDITAGELLCSESGPFTHFIFPQSGIVSIQSPIDNNRSVEVISAGYEGFVGLPLLAFGNRCEGDVISLVSGVATFVPSRSLKEVFELHSSVRQSIMRYGRFAHRAMIQALACAKGHRADQLIAFWLLVASDRLDAPDIRITHETLANLLGLRRATVTNTLAKFAQSDVLETRRGVIHISMRDRLESFAGRYYRNWRNAFDELREAPPASAPPYP